MITGFGKLLMYAMGPEVQRGTSG